MSATLDIKEVPYLNRVAAEAYEKYRAIKEEKSRLQARIAELAKAEALQDNLLKTQFGEETKFRRLVGGLILTRKMIVVEPKIVTPEMVGTVVRKGYEYPEYKEIEG